MHIARLELHYHLKDNLHSMDAVVRNKCEAEALALIAHVAQQLGIEVKLESSAYGEGGLKEIWKFMGKSNSQLAWLLAILVLILSRFPVTDAETDKLNKELLKLSIEEKKANVEKLKRELKKDSPTPPPPSKVGEAATILEGDLKVATRRSNFYRQLLSYDRVTAVGFAPLSEDAAAPNESTVARGDFFKFIQQTDKLPIEVVEEASIEIVAPVLKEGNYQWKGIYQDQPISFAMVDELFKQGVLTQQVTFQHGTTIKCVLHIHRKFNEVGDVAITGYSVATVLSKSDAGQEVETVQGKRHRFTRTNIANQVGLFDDMRR